MKDFLRIDVMDPLNIFLVELHMPLNTMRKKFSHEFIRPFLRIFQCQNVSKLELLTVQ